MVSLRCKLFVKDELDKVGIDFGSIDLGEVEIREPLTTAQSNKLKAVLHAAGLELMDDGKTKLLEKIKNVIIEMVHYAEELPKVNFSEYISTKVGVDYKKLSALFSQTKGMTIEHYIILHKIEKVKELLIYDQLSLTEIAFKMHYSSAAHLSNQFKKVTGLTPTYFKTLRTQRQALEEL
ncbi:MAG: helix-turn-helix domain-containing protein [Cryomorphaceae bacterium]